MPLELKRRKLSVGPCEYCKKAETMYMVQCDDCDKWFHYHCAGVGLEIEHLNWSCYVCKNQDENRKTTEMFQGRHDNCKKTILPKPKINYLSSQSKNIDTDDKRQIRELSQNLADLKIEIGSKNERIDEQRNMLEVQGKQIEGILENLADLKIEIGSKNERIDEQRNMLEVQEKQIEGILENLADLKIEIGSKNEQIDEQRNKLEVQQKRIDQFKKPVCQQQGEHVKDVADVEKEFDSVTIVGIFMNLLCDTEEELATFNTKLRNPHLVCGLQGQFCIFGGDLKTFIIGMLNRIMSKDLQSKISWSGKRTLKPGFADFSKIIDLIHFCCAKKFEKYDSKAGDQIIQKLLQNA